KEKNLLVRMCKRLDIPKSVYQRIERRVASGQLGNAAPVQPTKPMGLADACTVLGVSRWTSKQDIKLAYRRLMSQHHPDKLLARNSSKQEVEQATEKVQQIKSAYEMICKIKKFR
ncbi:MAG: DnaJ domain-containing protein, partial [Gammaproteobacteria bacterium]|nr:DnaJ domain-containing protein [Gammaproteobacteria bacterium]